MNSALGENKNQQLALTQSQSLIWTGQQLSADAPIYNMAFLFTWEGAIDPAIFRQAFARLLEQSDAMRTVFLPTDGQAVQQVLPQMEFELEQLDFSDRTAEDISQWAKKRSTQSFDIETRLFDSALLRLGPDRSAWYLCQHHLITDGWSKTVQYKALADFYQQIAGQQALTELPPFADYVHFEAEKRQRPVADYWQRSQEWPAHKALFHGQANADRRTESVRIGFQLDADKTAALRAIALEPDLRAWTVDLSLFQIFSTLLFACINRISGQQKLTVGIPVPNRPSAQFKKTPGLFTELFPLMVEVKGGDTFASLFQRVRAEAFECLKFATPGQSRAAVNKGFQVVLNYMNGSFDDFDGRPVQAEWIFADHADPGHHLRLQIFDFNKKGTIEVAIDANAAVFTEAQRTQLLADFAELLDRFLADRFQRIHPLSEAELALLQRLDLTEVGYPKHKTIVDLFEEQATTHPERMALSLGTQSMSYEQLNRRANQLAHWLRQEGVKEEVLVGLCMDRSFEMIIGLLAVQKAGGVYVPIDPDYPQQRIDYMLEDAVLGHLVTTSAHRDLFAKHDLQLHLIDDLEEMLKQQPVTLPVTDLTPDHPLYVIYTSGSTGRPKGVLITHCNVLRLMVNEQPLFDFGQSDVWTLFHSYCFDFSVWEMYGALLFGGRLVIVPKATSRDPQAYAQLLVDEQVTVLNQTPAAFYLLQDLYLSQDPKNAIRYIIFGGEALNPSRLAPWKQRFPDCQLINMYGITETCVHVTYRKVTDEDIQTGQSNIGTAIPTLECLILDEDLQRMPIGQAGEMYVGGAGLAKGYLNRPELTAERFIPHPFKKDSGARLYKTGDLGQRLPDGTIRYIGRSDNQVKIRGHRIELEEVASALNDCQSVKQSVVLAREGSTGTQQLVAYVIANGSFDQGVTSEELQQKVPEYMLPSLWVAMESFPLTVNGKIHKAALPEAQAQQEAASLTEPSTEFEELIAEVWTSVLSLERIGVHQNFFEIGGDSLSGIQAMARLNDALELDLKVNLIFQKNTIAGMAVHVEEIIRELLMEMDNSEAE